MNLYELLAGAGLCADVPDCCVSGVTEKIDKVKEGSVFVAVKGESRDGNQFAERALEKGAVCIVSEEAFSEKYFVRTDDARRTLSYLCSSFYRNPQRRLKMVGVTGTNGKTTVCEYISHLLSFEGKKCAVIGTLGAKSDGVNSFTGYTTPSAEILYEALDGFVRDGCEYCIMEVSSQALAQKRVEPIRFSLAAFTNIGTDHLDYHGSFDAYLDAKCRLAELSDKILVNTDDVNFLQLIENFSGEKYTFSAKNRTADFSAKDIRYSADSASYIFFDKKSIVPVSLFSIGEISVYNSLCALASAELLGADNEKFSASAESLPAVRGRMQKISSEGIDVYVDFAHTPQALELVLRALRQNKDGRLITVFGCGGNRDKGKRPAMGRIASELSDTVILTDDNPRNEDSSEIISDILSGIGSKRKVVSEPDRRKAIEKAIKKAKNGDTVLIAGKGHELYQIIGSEKQYFSDELTVKQIFGLV